MLAVGNSFLLPALQLHLVIVEHLRPWGVGETSSMSGARDLLKSEISESCNYMYIQFALYFDVLITFTHYYLQ